MGGEKTEAFVKRYGDPEQEPDVGRLTLYGVTVDGSRTPCESWRIPHEKGLIDLLELIEERALLQANTFGGNQAFMLAAEDKQGRARASDVFRVSGEVIPGAAITREPANEGGGFAQMMRHCEILMHTHVMGFEKMARHSASLIESADKRATAAEARNLDWLSFVSKIVGEEREREVALKKEEMRGEVMRNIAGRVTNLLPEVAASFVKAKAPHGAAYSGAIRVKGLFDSLNNDQIKGILDLLTQEQQMLLFKTMKELAAEEEAAKASGEPQGNKSTERH